MSDTDDGPPYAPDRIHTSRHTHDAPDGTALALTVFRPAAVTDDDPAPVLLQRTPYGRPEDPPEGGFAARALAAGYAVAFEDTRGRGGSDGAFEPWRHEGPDGAATVEWLGEHPWATGVGMFGGSSPGQVQLFAAAEDPAPLGAIAPTFTPSDLHRSDFFQDGAMSAMTFLTWSIEAIAGDTVDRLVRRGRLDDATAAACHDAIEAALERIPALATHRPLVEVPERVFGDVALPAGVGPTDLIPHWRDWTGRPTYDDFWRAFDPEVTYDRMTVPGLHTTGWYELCQHGTVTNYTGMRDAASAPQHLVIGPWAHQNQGRTVGAVDFGPDASAAAYGRDDQLLAFFDTYLRGTPRPPFDPPGERVVETLRASVAPDGPPERTDDTEGADGATYPGRGEWVRHGDWPPSDARRERWSLSSSGAAASDLADGRLVDGPPGKHEPADTWTHDPTDPVPTRGGPLCCRDATREPGAFDRRDLQERPDVATYTTSPFEAPVELAGPVSVELAAATTAPDTDFVAILSHVTAGGRAFNLCEGIRRARYRYGRDRPVTVPDGEPMTVPIDCWHVHYEIPAGDRLRLEVASSNHPRFDPHPGTTDPWGTDSDAVRTAEQTVFHALDRESTLTVHRRDG